MSGGIAHRDKLYGRRWKKASAFFLSCNPLCRMCGQLGRATPATVVDHTIPHRGNETLFWDVKNWQPLCKPCHDGPKQRMEHSGRDYTTGTDGQPIDNNDPWYQTG